MFLTKDKDPELPQSAGNNLTEEIAEPWRYGIKELWKISLYSRSKPAGTNQVKYTGCTKSCNDFRPVGTSNPETSLYKVCKPVSAKNHASTSGNDARTS